MYFIIFVVILVVAVIVIYNTMLSKKNKLLKAYSSLDVMLKKRYDLIPNLVECVKGYSEYESNTLNKIISLRKVADECNNAKELESVNNQYNDYECSIYMLAEKYPDLKANESYITLQKTLTDMEEQISAARRTYNAHVENYNSYISYFPLNIISNAFGFKKYEFFEIKPKEKGVPKSI